MTDRLNVHVIESSVYLIRYEVDQKQYQRQDNLSHQLMVGETPVTAMKDPVGPPTR